MADQTENLFDYTDWTIGDFEDYEAATGRDLLATVSFEPSLRDMKALIWISKRRQDPEYTLDMVRDVKLSEIGMAVRHNPPNGASATQGASDAGSPPLRIGTRGARQKRSGD